MPKKVSIAFLIAVACFLFSSCPVEPGDVIVNGSVINHLCTSISAIPASAITQAKDTLHIAYGHTSHGSQLVDGLNGLDAFMGGTGLYAVNDGETGGALDLQDTPFSASDLGNPNLTAWAGATRTYLNSHPETNVVIWSWCGQVSGTTEADIANYLNLMAGLEIDFPTVAFVYMTGHLDGSGADGNLNLRNEQIRRFCIANERWLYDFADIESYDPDGNEYLSRLANDGCYYDSDGDGNIESDDASNWAITWQNAHPGQWYSCSSAHSVALNANRKAYAAWHLWARIAGWNP